MFILVLIYLLDGAYLYFVDVYMNNLRMIFAQ